jgi:hypothetical protein
VKQIAPGLWRWTAPHPAWVPDAQPDSPDDWGQMVGCVLYQAPVASAFIDPLVPTDEEPFWHWADELVAGRPVVVLTSLRPHRRSRDQVAHRYDASTSRAKRDLPSGVQSFVVRGARETMFWLPGCRALIAGHRILGAPDGGLRLCPESWLQWMSIDRAQLRALLEPLLELPIEMVIVSHGEPVLRDGRGALRRCLLPDG